MSLMWRSKDLGYVLMKYPELLGFKLEGIMSTLVAYLASRNRCYLWLPIKDKMSTKHYFFSVKLKIDPEGFARVVEKMPRVVSLKQLSITVIMKPFRVSVRNLWNWFLNCSDQRFEERLECNFTDADMPNK
ncbi:unnamed protein product [Brassica rapa subsp. narinosa]|uniref:Uncharacterized protein n=1 Tax=Brassica campestris TaxID=3711 RepID=M4DMX8_BRACM